MALSSGPPRTYKTVNRTAWTQLARHGNDSSRPYGVREFARAAEWLDPDAWFAWPEITQVLCLASGGGQQAPLFASVGCQVVSADICPEQLQRDASTARQYGHDVECVEADMLDLSGLTAGHFDLVFQAVSACYVPNVHRLYGQVFRVLRPGGFYRVEHWNPINMQLSDDRQWTGRGYELVSPLLSGYRRIWRSAANAGDDETECWHYIHTLTDLIGGLGATGFHLLHFRERGHRDEHARPGTDPHVHAFAPPFLCLYAQKPHTHTLS